MNENGSTATAATIDSKSQLSPGEEAFFRAIEAQRAADPLVGAKFGSKEINRRILASLTTPQGAHAETLFCMLGALAGHACQLAVRARARAQGLGETALMIEAKTSDGRTFFMGDALNAYLYEAPMSIWNIANAAAGATLVDPRELFGHVTSTIGRPAFGLPRIPGADLPAHYVRDAWPVLEPIVRKFCPDPDQWPVLFALSIADLLTTSSLPSENGRMLQLAMESAIAMSKVGPAANDEAVPAIQAPARQFRLPARRVALQIFGWALFGAVCLPAVVAVKGVRFDMQQWLWTGAIGIIAYGIAYVAARRRVWITVDQRGISWRGSGRWDPAMTLGWSEQVAIGRHKRPFWSKSQDDLLIARRIVGGAPLFGHIVVPWTIVNAPGFIAAIREHAPTNHPVRILFANV